MLLLIETATKICSVGIAHEGQLLTLQEDTEGFNHASQLTLLIQKACKASNTDLKDLDAVAVSIGPGSYTGLRIGLSTAKGICFSLGKPLIAIDTLASLFDTSKKTYPIENALFVPMIDARRMEVYTTFYNAQNEIVQNSESLILDENSFNTYLGDYQVIVFSGDGAEKCKTLFTDTRFKFANIRCSAANFVQLATRAFINKDFADVAYIEPNYFKPPNITKPKKKL